MNKFYLILWALLFMSTSLFAQPNWERTYSNLGNDNAVDIIDNQNDTYTILAETSSDEVFNSKDIWLYTVDAEGEIIWEKTFGNPDEADFARKIIQFNDEYWIIATNTLYRTDLLGNMVAEIEIGESYDIVPSLDNNSLLLLSFANPPPLEYPRVNIQTLNTEGIIQSSIILDDNQDADHVIFGENIIATSDGNYIISCSDFITYDDTFYKITSDGTIIWKKTYDWSEYGEPSVLIETPEGNYLVAGFYVSDNNLYDHAYTLNPDGELIWQSRLNVSNEGVNYGGTLTSDGGVVLANTQMDTINNIRIATAYKIDFDGNLIWQQLYSDRNAKFRGVIETSNNDLIMVGAEEITSNNKRAIAVRTNSEGEIIADCDDERIDLNTQAEVDAWPGCTVVDAVWITGEDITDLSPLAGLIQAKELVISNCPNLQNLNGLQDLTIVDSTFVIINDTSLVDISALNNLTTATGFFYLSGLTTLPTLNGLQSLTKTNTVYIEQNALLQNLDELQGIQEIETLQIYSHDNLTEINLPNLLDITVLQGLQIINNARLTSIIGLDNIENIEFGAIIAANEVLPDMTWLSSLQSVGDLFVVASNNSLTTVNGLEQLTSIGGGFELSNNPALLEVNALSNLTMVVENINFLDNTSLESCCGLYPLLSEGAIGSSNISGNAICNSIAEILFECQPDDCTTTYTITSQAEIDNFIGCDSILGQLIITGNDIVNLNGLSSIVHIEGALSVSDNPNLTSLTGLNNLQSVGFTILLRNNAVLTDLSALSNIQQLQGQLVISGNEILQNLNGFNNLSAVNDIILNGNESLSDINAFNQLNTLGFGGNGGFLHIIENNSLPEINNFNQLNTIPNQLIIAGNNNLQSLNAFQNITSIGAELILTDNISLSNLNGFQQLQSVGADAYIHGNNVLQHIDELMNLNTVDRNFEISFNSELSDCCGIYPLLNEGTVFGNIRITDNPSPCSNQAQVLSFCDDGVLDGVDLKLEITADRAEYAIYRDIVYTISVTNEGTADATNVRVSVPKAAGFGGELVLTGFRNLTDQNINYQSVIGQFNIPNVPAGETLEFELVLFPLIGDQAIDVFGQIVAQDQPDVDSINDFDSDQIPDEDDEALVTLLPINSTTPISDLEIYITSDMQFASIGDEVTYTVSVTNKGAANATGISVSHLDIFGQDYLTHTLNGGNYDETAQLWDIGNLAVGNTVMLNLTTIIDAFTNNASKEIAFFQIQTADQYDTDSSPGNAFGNNYGHEDDEAVYSLFELSNDIGNTPDLELNLTVDNTEYTKFSYVTYNLTVTNTGASPATGIKIDWQEPEGLAYHEAIVSNGRFYSWSGEWFLDTPIEAGASENIEFTLWTNVEGIPITSYAQVVQMDGPDADSFVGNGTCCIANEDDEAAITIGGNNINATTVLGLQAATTTEAASIQATQLRKVVVHNVFPNPATDYVNLGVSTTIEDAVLFSVYNASGIVVQNGQLAANDFYQEHKLNITNLPAGLYIVRFHTGEDHAPVRFMKQKL